MNAIEKFKILDKTGIIHGDGRLSKGIQRRLVGLLVGGHGFGDRLLRNQGLIWVHSDKGKIRRR